MLVIPEIMLFKGKCKFKIKPFQSNSNFYESYSDSPIKMLGLLRRENSKSVFINCIDFNDNSEKYRILIKELALATDIPKILYLNSPHPDLVHYFIDSGIYRIAFDCKNMYDLELVRMLSKSINQSRLSYFLKVKSGKILSPISQSYEPIAFVIRQLCDYQKLRITLHPGKSPSKLTYKFYNEIIELCETIKINCTLYRGAFKAEQLWHIHRSGSKWLDSVVLADSFYNNKFPCQIIWRMIEPAAEKFDN